MASGYALVAAEEGAAIGLGEVAAGLVFTPVGTNKYLVLFVDVQIQSSTESSSSDCRPGLRAHADEAEGRPCSVTLHRILYAITRVAVLIVWTHSSSPVC